MNAEIASKVRGKGRSLRELGVREVAFLRNDALALVDLFEETGMVILGGDVYSLAGENISPGGESWFFDPEPGVSGARNSRGSAQAARDYLRRFPATRKGEVLFSFVIQDCDLDAILQSGEVSGDTGLGV